MTDHRLELARIRAITLDLDDTLWPVWPTIERAQAALVAWLAPQAPRAAALADNRSAHLATRQTVLAAHPEIAHDLGAQRLYILRHMLTQAGEDPALAEPGFAVFHEARQRVELFDDALPALTALAERYPSWRSTANADVTRIGIGHHFRAAVSAARVGVSRDARIFHAGADAAGVRAEVLHIGDDPTLDGHGALIAGMQFAWINRLGFTLATRHPGRATARRNTRSGTTSWICLTQPEGAGEAADSQQE